MRTRHRGARPAKAKLAPAEEAFTARERDAAEQLIHLSESSSSSGAPRTAGRAPEASRSSSSPRSVNTSSVLAPVLPGCRAGPGEDGEQEVAGSRRRVKRYRLIAEIYAATEEIGGRGSRKNKIE
ncbi:uncharacterized protein LOC124657488 [Lolium rigidum]|uniref:uncharacterized protein LOC124657488 n=1 Tax=Lolium rigidum TaxID=89674 RepID=UPI001F5C2936|nr:uncharacterized protein LOC124657488 [Lolium rigidum]